jgi:gas vesicle protein
MAQRNTHSTLWMPLAAGLLGAGLALLFAPRLGKETREKLHESAADLKHKAEDGLSSARDTLDSSMESAKEMKERLAKAIKRTGKKAKDEMDEFADTAETGARNAQSSVLNNWEEEV